MIKHSEVQAMFTEYRKLEAEHNKARFELKKFERESPEPPALYTSNLHQLIVKGQRNRRNLQLRKLSGQALDAQNNFVNYQNEFKKVLPHAVKFVCRDGAERFVVQAWEAELNITLYKKRRNKKC